MKKKKTKLKKERRYLAQEPMRTVALTHNVNMLSSRVMDLVYFRAELL